MVFAMEFYMTPACLIRKSLILYEKNTANYYSHPGRKNVCISKQITLFNNFIYLFIFLHLQKLQIPFGLDYFVSEYV